MKRLVLIFHICLACLKTHSQDMILSDYQLAPMYLNPALAGNSNDLRMTGLVQILPLSKFGAKDITSYSISFDTPIKLKESLSFGVGYQFFLDLFEPEVKFGAKNHHFYTSLTKRYVIDDLQYKLSFGIEGAFNQRSINGFKSRWVNHLYPLGFNTTYPTHTQGIDLPISYFDLNIGANYQINAKNGDQLDAGFTINHSNSPNITELSESFRIYTRMVYYLHTKFMVNDKFGVKSSVLYTHQELHSSYVASIGGVLDFKNMYINLNVGYQKNDLPFISANTKIGNFKLGFVGAFVSDFEMKKYEGFVTYHFTKVKKKTKFNN